MSMNKRDCVFFLFVFNDDWNSIHINRPLKNVNPFFLTNLGGAKKMRKLKTMQKSVIVSANKKMGLANYPTRQTSTFPNTVIIFVSWYNKELSSWYLAKMRHQVDVYLISTWSWYLFDLILMSWTWKIIVQKVSNRWLKYIYWKSFVWSGSDCV
jgi:hypothetical protein